MRKYKGCLLWLKDANVGIVIICFRRRKAHVIYGGAMCNIRLKQVWTYAHIEINTSGQSTIFLSVNKRTIPA